MKRVLVIGPGGSGKSTFAKQLGQILDIEVKHLDRQVWNYSHRSRPKVIKLINENSESKKVVWLRSNADVERFLKRLDTGHYRDRASLILRSPHE